MASPHEAGLSAVLPDLLFPAEKAGRVEGFGVVSNRGGLAVESGLELENCPFCAGDGWLIEDRGDNGCEVLLYRPQCRQCGAGLGGFDHPEEAAEAWNTRALPPSSAPLLEALEAWFKAEKLRRDTLDAYNVRLASEKARGSFPPSVDVEYQAWRDADKAEWVPRYALFDSLAAISAAKGASHE